VPEERGLADAIAEQRELLARLRAVVGAKDAGNQVLRAELEAARERERRLELRLAELERRLRMDSTDSGTPTSKEPAGARERRRAERLSSERERRKDRRRGGQPGHPGRGLARDPDPGERKDADPPAQCRRCGTGLDGAAPAAPGWAQVVDVQVIGVLRAGAERRRGRADLVRERAAHVMDMLLGVPVSAGCGRVGG
jgi:transposase